MMAQAKAKMVRTSPRKLNLVAALVRGHDVVSAEQILANTNKAATKVVGKVLDSAVANAENNHNLKRKDLTIESVLVGAGPTLKRIRPRSRGQANRILHRTSHLTIVVTDQKLETKATPSKAIAETKAGTKPVTKKPAKSEEKK